MGQMVSLHCLPGPEPNIPSTLVFMSFWESNENLNCLWPLLASSVTSVVSDSLPPMDYSPPGSSVHGILQARILEQVVISFSRGSSQPRDGTHVLCISRQILYHWAIMEARASDRNMLISHFPMSSVGARHNFPSAALFKPSVEQRF